VKVSLALNTVQYTVQYSTVTDR